MPTRKYLPFSIAKSFNKKYVYHMVADFETCYTSEAHENVRVWAWGLLDYINGEYNDGTDITSFLDKILKDRYVYDIAFHNMKFDGSFIIPALYKLGYKYIPNNQFMDRWQAGESMAGLFTHNITAMGQWFSITIAKDTYANKSTPAFVHLWDSLKLFPVKLADLGVQYNTKAQKIKVDKAFYEAIRPEGHKLTQEESDYLKADCETLAAALVKQLEQYETIYRTQASKAFTFFKAHCTDEADNNNYKIKYEGIQQWKVPEIKGLEDYKGATVRYLPRAVRNKIDKSGAKLIDAFEYYIPDFYTWNEFKQAYTGGISYVNPLYAERSIYEKVTVIDVNSMYPYCLRSFPIPYGRFKKIDGAPDMKEEGVWIACARVSFKLKDPNNLPCIQIKEKYGRKWLAESTDYMKYGEVNKYNEDVIYFTSVDFETFNESYDFIVHKWIYHYRFFNASNKDGKAFVDKYYKQKVAADQIMKKIKKEKPDSYKEDPRYIKAALERQEAKVLLNSAYGKHGTKYFLYSKDSMYIGPDEPVQYVAETKLQRDPQKDPSHYYCPYAAFVTAYARRMLVKTWNSLKGRALYCDTDSIHFLGEDVPEALNDVIDHKKTGDLGLWKVENVFTKARYIRPKTYIEVEEDGTEHVTCAGATPDIKKLMTWETFRVGFNAWKIAEEKQLDYRDYSKLTPKQYPDGVALEYVNYEISPLKLR